MNNLISIQRKIDKLQTQASKIRRREFDKILNEILAKMQAVGITAKDIQSASEGKRRRKKGSVARATGARKRNSGRKQKTSRVAAKYRGPNGETWSGRGLTPRWLAPLLAKGKTKADFAVES